MRTGVVPVHKSRFRGRGDFVEQSADCCGGGKICRAVPEMIVKEFCRLPLDEFHGMAFLGLADIRIPSAHQTGAGKEMKILPFYGNSAQPAHIEIEETAERMTLLDGDEKLFDRDFRGIQEKKGVIAGWLFADLCIFYGEAAELFLQFPEFLAKSGPGEIFKENSTRQEPSPAESSSHFFSIRRSLAARSSSEVTGVPVITSVRFMDTSHVVKEVTVQ